MKLERRGFSLLELMVVLTIASVIIVAIIRYFSSSFPFYHRMQVRQQVMSSSRSCMDTILDRLRNGRARTLVISTPTTTPTVPNSRVDFSLQSALPSGANAYAIYLDSAKKIVYGEDFNGGTSLSKSILASNVTGLIFTGDSRDPGIVGVTLRIDEPWDASGDPTHVSTIILPNHIVHMVETP